MLSSCYARNWLPQSVMYVEFLGIPRERAGISELQVEARTLGQLLETLTLQCPALGELITPEGLHRSIAANLNGDTFVSDLATPLAENDRLLILSADVGG
jgi:molybdopterin converting factor small subunit